jgi:hypothetical protein
LSETSAAPDSQESSANISIIVIAAWLVPGLGHLLLRRWGRGIVLCLCVAGLAATGLLMRGRIYSPLGEDIFGLLGFLAEIGMGAAYFLARLFEPHGADVARVAGDFGTRFLAIAGLLNFLCVLDVWQLARGGKP